MAVSSQVVTSQLPAAFETYYKTGDGASKGLIPQAFELYGQGTPQAFQQQYVDPLKAAGLYGTDRIAGLSPAQQQLGQQIGLILSRRRQGFDTAAQVFRCLHHIACEFLRGIGPRIGHFALGPGAQVLHLSF